MAVEAPCGVVSADEATTTIGRLGERMWMSNRVALAPVEATHRAVIASICPFRGRSPCQVLAGHTEKVHGADRFELHELAGLTYSTNILDERTREEFSARLAAGFPLLSRHRSVTGQRKAESSRKPHPCPACGTVLATAHPITCSPACRRAIRVRTARASAAKRLSRRTANGEQRCGN